MTKTYAKSAVIAFFLAFSQVVFSQTGNISINLAGAASNHPAILDLSDASNAHLGFLMPNVSLVSATDATTIPSPTTGMIVWNTNAAMTGGLGKGFYYYTGSQWNYIYNSGTSNSLLNLTAGAGLSGSPYNGSVAQTWSVLYGSAASTAVQGNTQFTIAPGTGISGGGTITEGTGGTLTITNNGVVTTNNGLTVTANNAQLGGTNLTQQTNIPLNNNTLTVTGSAVTTTFATTGAVGIGNAPNASAVLDVNSTTQGMLIPRLAANPTGTVTSLLYYNTTTNCFMFYTGSAWQAMVCACSGIPVAPGTITGPVTFCINSTGNTYSVPVENATGYTWTVPAAIGTIISGQGTNTITVTAAVSPGNGTISVTATNACGTSAATNSSLVYANTTPILPVISSGYPNVCANTTGCIYSVPSVPGVTLYTWTVPTGASITAGAGTNSITVTIGSTSGNVTCYETSACGVSSTGTFSVTVSAHNATGALYSWNGTYSTSTNYQTGSVQTWIVPTCVTHITVTITGASGGAGLALGGYGAIVSGTITVTGGHVLDIVAGGQGSTNTEEGGGGGGSYLWDANTGELLAVAGGGGGAGDGIVGANGQTSTSSIAAFEAAMASAVSDAGGTGGGASSGGTSDQNTCGGGAGWGENGAIGGQTSTWLNYMVPAYYPLSTTLPAYGGSAYGVNCGGYGGGGACVNASLCFAGAGGGGYNGGGAGNTFVFNSDHGNNGGGGGGSYFSTNGGATASLPTSATIASSAGNGSVKIVW